MKTKLVTLVLGLLFAIPMSAQDRTTVNALSSEISDNLDLRAVASIFGEARNLEDFERQLNDPQSQISNLDLNNDNRVDYLRVIETVEGYTHLIVLQSVLGLDTYQDVATIEVERAPNKQVTVQVVGDVYMYGPNYIYEPAYVSPPVIYASFWVNHYRPYCSSWYWNFYPTHYYVWAPLPVFRYRNNVNVYINFSHHYNYVNVRHSHRAVALYSSRRANYCERQYPTGSFAYRNENVRNRYELDQTRIERSNTAGNNQVAYNNQNASFRGNSASSREYSAPRSAGNGRSNSGPVRSSGTTRNENRVRSDHRSIRESGVSQNESSGRSNQNSFTESGASRAENGVRSKSGQRATNSSRDEANSRINSSTTEYGSQRSYGNASGNSDRQSSAARMQENKRSEGNTARDYTRISESITRMNSSSVRENSRNINRPSENIAQNRIESGR